MHLLKLASLLHIMHAKNMHEYSVIPIKQQLHSLIIAQLILQVEFQFLFVALMNGFTTIPEYNCLLHIPDQYKDRVLIDTRIVMTLLFLPWKPQSLLLEVVHDDCKAHFTCALVLMCNMSFQKPYCHL